MPLPQIGFSPMKTLVIASSTAKEAIRQPAFWVLTLIAILLLLVFIFVPYFTFNEDIKMYKDSGLAVVLLCSLIMALITSSSTVAEEIEGKTAVTMLSKPINRRQFILGKFLGIEMAVLLMFLILGGAFALGVSYKAAYDLREAAGTLEELKSGWPHVFQMLPGLVLGFFEVTVLTAISVAISTRLPMLANFVVCLSIFLLGHLTPVLVEQTSQEGGNELVRFMARLFSWALPSLEFFNAGPAVATGAIIPWQEYVLPALGYCMMYSVAAILFAFLLFENRDVA
jgi:ABC-type transport system involved in multi-copper enzyme maturation permease subunit